jgi:hypothetical protein
MNRQDQESTLPALLAAKGLGSEIVRFQILLERVLAWRGLDGDGITDPLRGEIIRALGRWDAVKEGGED